VTLSLDIQSIIRTSVKTQQCPQLFMDKDNNFQYLTNKQRSKNLCYSIKNDCCSEILEILGFERRRLFIDWTEETFKKRVKFAIRLSLSRIIVILIWRLSPNFKACFLHKLFFQDGSFAITALYCCERP